MIRVSLRWRDGEELSKPAKDCGFSQSNSNVMYFVDEFGRKTYIPISYLKELTVEPIEED